MAKCNLLKPTINTDLGTFYTFSQWSEDMTLQNALGDAYRIVPSRFACFNIDTGMNNIGQLVQDGFEHPCAAFRHVKDIDTQTDEKFSPRDASILFWDMLVKQGISSSTFSEIVYAGEMDLQGTNYIDGVTYSELYCSIPSNAKEMSDWELSPSQNVQGISWGDSGTGLDYGTPFGWTGTLPSGAHSDAVYPVELKGYYDGPTLFATDDAQTRYSSLNTLDSLHKRYMNDLFDSESYFSYLESSYFEFNMIVLFYDIVAKDEHNDYHYIYTAVPMGMYVTPNLELVRKYVTNDDIYGQGSSYGLRVTTKFCAESLLNQPGSTRDSEITVSIETLYPELAAVIDRFNATTEALDRYTESTQNSINSFNSHLSIFKDHKVNVPYIREIKGENDTKPEKYWFINGRSTGVKVSNEYTINYDGQTGDLEDLIRDVVIGDEDIEDYISDMIDQHINDAVIDTPQYNYIEYINKNKYYDNQDIVRIPQLEDFQDLDGDCSNIFNGCSSLAYLPKLELHNTTSLNSTFYNCSSLTTLYIPDTISCTDFSNAFNGCSNLVNLCIDATSATSFDSAFTGCSKLKNLRITNIDPTKIDYIDLSNTDITFSSLENIIMSMQSQIWNDTFDVDGPDAKVTIKVPVPLRIDNRSIMDLVYNAQMNKNIRINIV